MRKSPVVGLLACAAALAPAGSALAATEVVTESHVVRQAENTPPTNDWVLYTRPGTPATAGQFVEGPATPPLGTGSFQSTTATGAEKVFLFNYDHVGTKLGDLGQLGYSTYRTAGSAQQAPALNMQIDYNGPDVAGGFSTLVFEPVYTPAQGAVVSGAWQTWDADAGVWWSTQPINGQCAGATAACDKTWSEIVANNPDAIVGGGFGINQGSGNPGLLASSDALTIGATTYDFETTYQPTDPEQCKKGGYATFVPPFRNQGQCVSSFAPGRSK